jgi:chaperonin GroEL
MTMQTEVKEKKDRVDDALHATKAALEEGIVPGGGVALYRASILAENNSLKQDKTADQLKGIDIVYKACKIPFEQLLDNAGYDKDMIYRLKNSLFINQHNYWLGYNIKSDSQVNMKEGGIIDPVKVTRIALENASAVAGTVLLTECVIVDKPKEEKEPEPSMMY